MSDMVAQLVILRQEAVSLPVVGVMEGWEDNMKAKM